MKSLQRLSLLVALCLTQWCWATEMPKAKYVFFFIGDGMATTQRAAAEYYLGAQEGRWVGEVPVQKLVMNSFPAQGMTSTYSLDDIITDSAASATALATGHKTDSGVIAMDSTRKIPFKTLAETAKQQGLRVGIITSVCIDHATPACFYAHCPSRNDYYEISRQLVDTDLDYVGGGQMKGNLPRVRRDRPDLLDAARKKGWALASNREELAALVPGQKAMVYTTCDKDAALNYSLDRRPEEVTLAEFTRKGIDLLFNDQGFFFMVEGGKIDWACHANDAATAIGEVLALDQAIAEAVDFARQHPAETLIVVTGDHECGGMTLGFAGTKYQNFPQVLQRQTMSFLAFDQEVATWRQQGTTFDSAWPRIQEVFGFERLSDHQMESLQEAYQRSMLPGRQRVNNEQTYLAYGNYEPLSVQCTHLINQQGGLDWTSYSHTGVPVLTSAMGVGAEAFNGYYDNTDIYRKIRTLMQLPEAEKALAHAKNLQAAVH